MEETEECFKLLEELFAWQGPLHTEESQKVTSEERVPLIKVLVTPLGMSPGLLYTALTLVNPQHAVVVTSAEGKTGLKKIKDEANYGGTFEIVEVGDPFTSFEESSRVVGKMIDYLEKLPPFHLYINLTGGTTLLQYIVSKLAKSNIENCREITTVAMVDRRPVEEQQKNPYVQGKMIIVEDLRVSCIYDRGQLELRRFGKEPDVNRNP